MNVKIRAGNGLRARLATTVSFDGLFTELVKNSLQNNATEVHITYNNQLVRVLDNGDGFDHVADNTGLNEFEKYFVYGNSYTKKSKTLNLGEMGIGGKAANDKLSDMTDTHWSIHTTNRHGKSFELTFKSTDEKYLDQVQPQLREVPKHYTGIDTPTGASVMIHNINPELKQNGWPHAKIRENLQLFFNMLYFQTEKQNRSFKLWVNGQPITFNRNLPGDRWLTGKRVVSFNMQGENRQLTYEYQLNHLSNREQKHLLSSVDLVSYTRVCPIKLNPAYIDTSEYEHFDSDDACDYWNKQIRGYITCNDLSDIKDHSNMSAKHLSHAGLNKDHPVTKAFMKDLHEFISRPLCRRINDLTNPDKLAEKTLNHVSGVICARFNIPDKFIVEK